MKGCIGHRLQFKRAYDIKARKYRPPDVFLTTLKPCSLAILALNELTRKLLSIDVGAINTL